jgi:hypothetical protein
MYKIYLENHFEIAIVIVKFIINQSLMPYMNNYGYFNRRTPPFKNDALKRSSSNETRCKSLKREKTAASKKWKSGCVDMTVHLTPRGIERVSV